MRCRASECRVSIKFYLKAVKTCYVRCRNAECRSVIIGANVVESDLVDSICGVKCGSIRIMDGVNNDYKAGISRAAIRICCASCAAQSGIAFIVVIIIISCVPSAARLSVGIISRQVT